MADIPEAISELQTKLLASDLSAEEASELWKRHLVPAMDAWQNEMSAETQQLIRDALASAQAELDGKQAPGAAKTNSGS